jgi:predicted small metal-binding protein
MFTLACADLGMPSCPFVAKGDTEDGVIMAMKEHALSVHPEAMEKMKGMPEADMMAMMKKAIKSA